MFGFEIPKNYAHSMELYKRNYNTRWKDFTQLELDQLYNYSTFKDMSKFSKTLYGHKKIRTHLVYAVKHDGRQKARMVVNGHLTDIVLYSV